MFRELLVSEWASYGKLSDDQIGKLQRHYELLTRWNTVLNLTRILKLEEAVRFHYCESLFLGSILPPGQLKIADLGSGAGFPGIPVAVLRPECAVALVESHQRKAVFLGEACAEIPNMCLLPARAESIDARYDWIVSRAVAPSAVLSLRLSSSVAILMSESDLAGLPPPAQIIQVPWGKHRVVAMFHVERLDGKI
jgi:16S rRNA (guanine(527)-N(7))-methyltransferase RsmG